MRGSGHDISRNLWRSIVGELAERSGGNRESGAFLLAPRDQQRTIVAAAYYDDLDAKSLTGAVQFGPDGFSRLWERCAADGVNVVGDVHTHPTAAVTQSAIDRANPMIDRVGHMAIVIPNYAADNPGISKSGVNVHLGQGRWKKLTGFGRWRQFRVGLR